QGYLAARGMAGERRRDVGSGDVLAGAAEEVLAAIDEMQRAVRPPAHHVAGVEPAVAPGCGRRLGVLEVAGEEAAARIRPGLPHQELSAFFVYQDLQRWRRAADAARAAMPRRP